MKEETTVMNMLLKMQYNLFISCFRYFKENISNFSLKFLWSVKNDLILDVIYSHKSIHWCIIFCDLWGLYCAFFRWLEKIRAAAIYCEFRFLDMCCNWKWSSAIVKDLILYVTMWWRSGLFQICLKDTLILLPFTKKLLYYFM